MSAENEEGAAGGGSPRFEVSVSVLRERYAAGDSAPTIAKGMGLTSRQVYVWMQREGIARRRPGAPKWAEFPVSVEELRRRYEAGASMSALSRALEVSHRAVKLRLLAAGTTLRQGGSGGVRVELPVSSQELRRRYEAGASLHDLAIELDVAVGTVEMRVLEAGGTLRPVGGRFGRNALVLPVSDEELRRRYEAGVPVRTLAEVLQVDCGTVRKRVKAAQNRSGAADE